MTGRYDDAVRLACERIQRERDSSPGGHGFVVVSPRQQQVVAEALARALDGFAVETLAQAMLPTGPSASLVVGLPEKKEEAKTLLAS